ncbi:MAG: hypothetical protein JHC95_22045 [Solirubrobacteraceae bacterium]|nr:hypothetical protein [Solirubrobacteraceae bacterium]
MPFRSVLAAAVAGAVLLPATASGAALTTDLPCYPEGYPVTTSGSGWGPNTRWNVQAEQVFVAGDADALGNFQTQFPAPIVPEDTLEPKTFTLSGTQDGAPVAQTTFQVINTLVKLDEDRGRPTGKTRWRFSGWAPNSTVYVHIRRGGKTLSNTKISKSKGPCGTGSRRMARLPGVSRPRSGTYKVFVDTAKSYSAKTRPQYQGSYIVYTTFR